MDIAVKEVLGKFGKGKKVDATNTDVIDTIIEEDVQNEVSRDVLL
jgi:hypothetical protein